MVKIGVGGGLGIGKTGVGPLEAYKQVLKKRVTPTPMPKKKK